MNTTGLTAGSLDVPLSDMSVQISQPDLGQIIPRADAARYEARFLLTVSNSDPLVVGRPESEAPVVAVALDGGRPRRVASARAAITLGELIRADEQLADGEHWLFAAPFSALGVPERAPGSPRSALARRFFVGNVGRTDAGASGAVWLLSPEGTYNGGYAKNITIDAFAFDALGRALTTRPTISLNGPLVAGEVRLTSPFGIGELTSGDYEVRASAPGASTVTTHFTINRELSVGP
ncbi:MAG TPA: hypothetical protein VGL19_24855 [Polyangiaceae bacterium]